MTKDIFEFLAKGILSEMKEEFMGITRAAIVVVLSLSLIISFLPWFVTVPVVFCAWVWLFQAKFAEYKENLDKDIH